MEFTTTQFYDHDIFTVKRYGDHTIRLSYLSAIRKSGLEPVEDNVLASKKGKVNTGKLSDNLIRAKSTVRELVLCNPWYYWCTFTISPEKYDRYDLKTYMQDFSEFIHNYNRRRAPADKVTYLLVPEQCKDGAWHLHGFIKGICEKDLRRNKYGYLTWVPYENRFGFISMDAIKDIDQASSYILKYMTKNLNDTVIGLNAHSFYASKGLQRAEELYRGRGRFTGEWDWEHPDGYVKIKTLDERKADISEIFEVTDK